MPTNEEISAVLKLITSSTTPEGRIAVVRLMELIQARDLRIAQLEAEVRSLTPEARPTDSQALRAIERASERTYVGGVLATQSVGGKP